MLATPPLSLYIHFPWCIRKCPYCDFNSHTLRDELPENRYIDALITDLDRELTKIKHRPLVSIFMGGGTPSLFSPAAIQRLLEEIKKRITFMSDIEITMEVNPGTVEQERFLGYHNAGINRLSLGIQSLQDEKLKALGRIHGADEAIRAVETVRSAGFTNFNLDLMHGLPNQTLEDGLFDLRTALSLQPTHLSWYQLTLEPNTLFAYQPPILPANEMVWQLQEQGYQVLQQQGFSQYEISAFSQPQHKCKHNINYWEFGDYLGIGAGAHGKITDVEQKTVTRSWKVKNPKDYLEDKNHSLGERKMIPPNELAFEFMLNALRLHSDIPSTLLNTRTGLALSNIETQLKIAQDKNLLKWDEEFIRPTNLGRRFYNDLVEIFL